MASNHIRPPQPQALNVPPLNSMPYVDSVASMCLQYDYQYPKDTKPAEPAKPALVFLPSEPTNDEWHSILSATSNGIGLTGSAAAGTIGPLMGKREIGESEDSYIFRVSLPGVAREDFTCDVNPDGLIFIKGVTTTGEKTVYKHSLKFDMQSQNLCPPGVFTITFKLPGPVDSQYLAAHFGIDGVFEGVVKKKMVGME
ncbi:alpha-crystallin domain-containing protein 22.3-like [Silene latifolia]|uniref:alpha-crystallin domain-containing protein 22.3-like n=1 Tax=Silene latifolia TaxID=37657 RepID=UPI003D76D55C